VLLRTLVEQLSAVTEFRSDLARVHNNVGWLMSQSGRPTGAEAEFRAALALERKLADDHPEIPEYRDAAAYPGNNLSVVLRRLGRPAEAGEHCDRAIAAREALAKEHPETPNYGFGLAENHLNRGLARRALGNHAGAAADLRRAVGLYDALPPSQTGEQWFLAACAHAALAGLAGQPRSDVLAAETESEAETAVALLHKAIGVGYRSPDAYRTEDALDRLRDRSNFQLLLMDLAMPAEPFAAVR
jgi:tetratricopeptide (TPR) repeat protein